MNLIKKNFDVALLLPGIALYAFQAAFFPAFADCVLLYGIAGNGLAGKTQNAGWARNPFRLDKQFDFPDYVLFWIFGWIGVVFWEIA